MLEVHSVSKRFGGLQVLKDVSFEVREGEIVGLIGPNGAGKTTLFNVISRFVRPESGDVRLRGRSLLALPPEEVCRAGLCRTFQVVKPFGNLSVLDNVVVGALTSAASIAEARTRAVECVDVVGLAPFASAVARNLPVGLRKRLEVARALATRPRILLLDEVMASLTPPEMRSTMELIRRVRDGGMTFLVIEHVMRAIMSLSDRVIVLDQGEKIAEGAPEAVGADARVVQAYLGEEYAGKERAGAPA